MNTPTPTLEQMINMKLDERTNENKQMDNILSNIQKHGNNGNYNKQAQEDIQDDELQMYRMQSMAMQNMAMQNMAMQNTPNMGMPMQNTPNMGMAMPMQNTPNMGMAMPMQNMDGPNIAGPNMGMPMQNMGMQNMPMQNMGMQNMQMQNMGMPMQNMGMGADGQMQKKHEINDLENLKTKKVISYIKNPLIVFIIFIVLNSSIIIQTIDNLLGFCNNASIISIINLIIRGLIGSLLYIIFTNILINV